jgi:hypothetical protein
LKAAEKFNLGDALVWQVARVRSGPPLGQIVTFVIHFRLGLEPDTTSLHFFYDPALEQII